MSQTKSKKQYEEYLNDIAPSYDSQAWIIGGKSRIKMYPYYGRAIRKHDPFAFEVGYNEWKRNRY